MKRVLIILILIICCETIWGQTDSLYEKSKTVFRNLDVNIQIKSDTLNNEKLYYIRQCFSNNEDFSHILHSIAEMKPYTLIYKIFLREIDGKKIISFAQCESCDDIISEIINNPEVSISGSIIVNNAFFYIFNMLHDNSLINKLITRSDSYNVIMKMNYPEDDVFFLYNRVLPLYIEDNGHIFEYK